MDRKRVFEIRQAVFVDRLLDRVGNERPGLGQQTAHNNHFRVEQMDGGGQALTQLGTHSAQQVDRKLVARMYRFDDM